MATPPILPPEVRAAVKAAAIVAANTAIKATLLTMGVDISSPEAVKEMQEDMAYLRNLRSAGTSKSVIYWTAIFSIGSSIVTAIIVLVIRQTFFAGVPHIG